jgi:hypothetical protein
MIEELGYRLCWRGGWISRLWAPIWYRWYCPCPIIADYSARACVEGGYCGCDNGPRLSQSPQVTEEQP